MHTSTLAPRLRALFSFGALLFTGAAIAACSAVIANASGDPSCAALGACCGTIPGPAAETCQEMAQAAKTSSSGASCAAILRSYQAEGYCGGPDGGGSSFDGGGSIACGVTGTCDASAAAATDAGGPQCQLIGSCRNGQTYEACTQTSASGLCSASIVFSDGARMACASCGDCATAAASASARCNGLPSIPDAAPPPPPADSGPSCGTAPALHPESVPGVYCPFTATGAVHCPAGDQCCEAPTGGVSSCAPAGTSCPVVGSLAWECTDPLDCIGTDAGAACCATGGTTAFDPACSYYRGSGFTGSRCAASCGAGETTICSVANDPCVSPATCTPFKVAGLVIGTCL